MQGADMGVRAIAMRLPVFVYDTSDFCSSMVHVHVQAASKCHAATYIDSGKPAKSLFDPVDSCTSFAGI